MRNYCSDCIFLNTSDSKESGIYKCKKSKEFTCASNCACQKFEKTYSRNQFEKQRLYDLGKEVENKSTTADEFPLVLLILIGIIILLAKLSGY